MAFEMTEVLSHLDYMAIDIVNFAMRQNQLELVHERFLKELKDSIDLSR